MVVRSMLEATAIAGSTFCVEWTQLPRIESTRPHFQAPLLLPVPSVRQIDFGSGQIDTATSNRADLIVFSRITTDW